MLIELNDLNEQEQKVVTEFRQRMKNDVKQDMYDDIFLFYRFLKARNFDGKEAEIMLRNHLVQRKLHQMDHILEDFKPSEFFTKYIEPSVLGFDREGSLVGYTPMGKIETKEEMKCLKKNRYKKEFIWLGEKLTSITLQRNEKSEVKCNSSVLIVDLDGLTLGNAMNPTSAEVILMIVDVFQSNYPEMLKTIYMINAPAYYVFVFTVVKTIMSNVMIKKIHVFGYSGWKEELLKTIDADVLPAFLGGNRTDPDGDPLCKTFVRHAGPILSSYNLSDEERYFKDKSRVVTLVVPRMSKREIPVDVTEVGSLIVWEFYTSSNINFGLLYEGADQKLEEVIPVVRYSTSDGTERDSLKVRVLGKYIIVFDNTYSRFSSKEVKYCIDVMPNGTA